MADVQMTLIEHLDDLRSRLIRAIVVIAILAVGAYIFRNEIMAVLTRPLGLGPLLPTVELTQLMSKIRQMLAGTTCNGQPCFTQPEIQALIQVSRRSFSAATGLIFIHPAEAFFGYIKLSLYTSVLVGAPFWLYQLWKFVVPALYAKEKRYAFGAVISGSALFYGGAAFCYFVVLPVALRFLISVGQPYLEPTFTLNNYISFTMLFLIGFGASFELPLSMFVIVKLGLVQRQTLFSKWRYAIAGAFLLATMLPSPDIFSQVAMGSALTVLYLLGLLVTRFAVGPEAGELTEGGAADSPEN